MAAGALALHWERLRDSQMTLPMLNKRFFLLYTVCDIIPPKTSIEGTRASRPKFEHKMQFCEDQLADGGKSIDFGVKLLEFEVWGEMAYIDV